MTELITHLDKSCTQSEMNHESYQDELSGFKKDSIIKHSTD